MMDLMRGSDSRVPSHFLIDQAMEGTMQNGHCFCNPDVATVKSSTWMAARRVDAPRAQSENLFLNEPHDDEFMMGLMRGSDSRVPIHFFIDQTLEMHGAKTTLFCNSDFATVTLPGWRS